MGNLILTGMMGCGKSTCAAALGRALGRPVVDTDEEIQKETGLTVSELFSQRGETAFRDLETAVARRLSQADGLIIATGGGLPLRAENRRLLRKTGTVIFLRRDPEEIYQTANLQDRPLAQGGLEEFLRRYRQREAVYLAFSHIVIDDFSSVEATVEAILNHLKEA